MRTGLDRFLLLALITAGLFGSPIAAFAASSEPLPTAIADLHGFRGRIDYVAQRDGVRDEGVSGSLLVGDRSWTLEERSPHYDLRAGSAGSSLVSPTATAIIDDVFDADPLANAWAATLGSIATQPVLPADATGAWAAGALRVFVDATGGLVTGITDARAGVDVAYIFGDWTAAGNLSVPRRVLRLRGGVPNGGFTVTGYRITPALTVRAAPATMVAAAFDERRTTQRTALLGSVSDGALDRGATAAAILACILVACLFAVAWTRREALVLAWCRKLARDPRGWSRAGESLFVEPDGALAFDGMRYRVGPHFYNRAVLVQCSVLFVRVSSPAVPHAVILPRRFRPVDLGVAPRRGRPASAGFTLVETLAATALFAAVVLLAIYPAVIAVARADAMAATRAQAVVLASNALADEEAIDDYDGGAPQGSTTTTTPDGLTLTVTVAPGPMHDVSDLDVRVADPSGLVLAHLTSWLGAPVNAPSKSNGPPGG